MMSSVRTRGLLLGGTTPWGILGDVWASQQALSITKSPRCSPRKNGCEDLDLCGGIVKTGE